MDGVFVLSEMLKLGGYLDFSDEMGRGASSSSFVGAAFQGGAATDRRVCAGEMLAYPILPQVPVSSCLDLLQKAS